MHMNIPGITPEEITAIEVPLMGITASLAVVVILLLVIVFLIRRERKRLISLVAERTATLQQEASLLNALFDSIPDILFCKDLDGRYTRVNKKFTELLGKEPSEVIGFKDTHIAAKSFADKWHESDKQVIETLQPLRLEEDVPFADGTTHALETIKVPLFSDGKCSGLLGLGRDITIRKIAEKALHNASLAKSLFLANMSHEIRTPMNSIVGFTELALESDMPPKVRTYLERITENANWLLQIINDILDLSKIEAGRMELENIPFDLGDLFNQCRTTILPRALEKGLKFHFYTEQPSDGKVLLGDPVRLRQIFINLMSNAVKFTNSGMVRVSSNTKVTADTRHTIYFEVKDSGIGMSPKQIERVFEPFNQADDTITRRYGGTGLGLAITRNLIEMMGGKMNVESIPSVGSKFSFELDFDVSDISEMPVKHSFSTLDKPSFSGDVLVCEDNEMNQMVISEHLSRIGLKCVIAENGLVGVERVKRRIERGQKPFDLILMDIHMPVLDGLDAAEKIIALDTGTPLVAMTANIMRNDKEIYAQRGMADCVGKPFTSQELWNCLAKYFESSSADSSADDDSDTGTYNSFIGDNAELLRTLQTSFLKENRHKSRELVEYIIAGDIEAAHRVAHTLKSTAALIGKNNLRTAAAGIESLLKAGESNVPEKQIELLERELKAVIDELDELLSDSEPTKPAILHDEAEKASTKEESMLSLLTAQSTLEQLEYLLKTRNPSALKMLEELRKIPGSGEMAALIERYDFKKALEALKRLNEQKG